MSLSPEIRDREYGKFIQTSTGDTAVRVKLHPDSLIVLDSWYIRLDGTSVTTSSIPFAKGLSVPASEKLYVGGMYIWENGTEYTFDGASDHTVVMNRHLVMGNTLSLGENFFYVGIPDNNAGKIWFDDSIGTFKIENVDNAATTGDIGIMSTQRNVFVQLGDASASYKFQVKDSGGNVQAWIDSDGKMFFTDTHGYVYASTSGNLVVAGDTTTTIGVAGNIVLGDGTKRAMYPAVTRKMDLGSGTNEFDFVYGYIFAVSGGVVCDTFYDGTGDNILLLNDGSDNITITSNAGDVDIFGNNISISSGGTIDIGATIVQSSSPDWVWKSTSGSAYYMKWNTLTYTLQFGEACNIVLGTTTGTKIGTSTSQKIGFFNATPVVQQTGDVVVALGSLGLVATPVITYGSMYGDEISQSVTISAANTYYEVGGGLSGGSCSGFTFQNSKELLCSLAGKYKVDWSIANNCATNNQDISGAVMINSTAQLNTTNHTFNGTGASKNVSISGTGIITLAVNDVVKLCVANHTATNNVVIEHANISLIRVGA